jgi:F-type H+-transporting ATPase subunit b
VNFNLTLLGQAISLAIFVIICMKYIWPHIVNGLKTRETRIADGLAAAEKGQKKLEDAGHRYNEMVDEGKQKAVTIISHAQKRGDEIIEESKQSAREEGNRILESAKSDIEQDKERAREELKKQVAALALIGAEQILMREIDQKVHNEVLNKIITDL